MRCNGADAIGWLAVEQTKVSLLEILNALLGKLDCRGNLIRRRLCLSKRDERQVLADAVAFLNQSLDGKLLVLLCPLQEASQSKLRRRVPEWIGQSLLLGHSRLQCLARCTRLSDGSDDRIDWQKQWS